MLDNWQRIEQIIKWAGIPSVNAFARELGLSRGENLYQIKRGNNGISKDLAQTVAEKYPEISKAWLLTGEGEMLPSRAAKIRNDIPFYKCDAVDLLDVLANPTTGEKNFGMEVGNEPEYFVSFPMIHECNFACFSLSDAMYPEIPYGSTIFLSQVEPGAIIPGNIYLIKSAKFSGIRKVRLAEDGEKFRLVPSNGESYDEVIVKQEDISELYRIKGILSIK